MMKNPPLSPFSERGRNVTEFRVKQGMTPPLSLRVLSASFKYYKPSEEGRGNLKSMIEICTILRNNMPVLNVIE